MSARRLDIGIAGAGFAGLAAASLLARDGHSVTVYDKFALPQSVGAGILLQPSGLAALRVLGIEQEVLRRGARIERLLGRSHHGWRVVDLRYPAWRAGSFGLGLHRGVLFEALWSLATRQGVRLLAGCEVRNLQALQEQHQLVVVADGCRSALRCQTGLASSDRVYPWGAVWAVLQDPQRRYGSTLHQWYRGAAQMLGVMPTGCSPDDDTPVVSLFWSLRADRLAAFREAGLAPFRREVLALHPEASPLLDQLQSMDQLTWARYHDVGMPAYHTDRCVVIGDAAHATSPQLGQGTNLALLDAVALAQCLREGSSVAEGLAAYTANRQAHLRFYGQASRWLTPLFQSDAAALPLLRDAFTFTGTRLPGMRRLTMETLAGVRQAWWRGTPVPLGEPRPDALPKTA